MECSRLSSGSGRPSLKEVPDRFSPCCAIDDRRWASEKTLVCSSLVWVGKAVGSLLALTVVAAAVPVTVVGSAGSSEPSAVTAASVAVTAEETAFDAEFEAESGPGPAKPRPPSEV